MPTKCDLPIDSLNKLTAYSMYNDNSQEEENNGKTATWYELPEGCTELKHLIWHKNMNAQVGEIFRSVYRLNDCPHSDIKRNLNKIIAYAEQELERIAISKVALPIHLPAIELSTVVDAWNEQAVEDDRWDALSAEEKFYATLEYANMLLRQEYE